MTYMCTKKKWKKIQLSLNAIRLVAAHQSVPATYNGVVCETVHLVLGHKGVQWVDPVSDYPDQKPIVFLTAKHLSV